VHALVRQPVLDPAGIELIARDARTPEGAVVFLGDSLTRALDTGRVVPGSYNYGIDGYQTRQLLPLLPKLRGIKHARLVVLTIGTNDVKHQQQPGIRVRLAAISKAIPGPLLWNAIPPSVHGEVASVNSAARSECAARTDCVFVETAFEAGDLYGRRAPERDRTGALGRVDAPRADRARRYALVQRRESACALKTRHARIAFHPGRLRRLVDPAPARPPVRRGRQHARALRHALRPGRGEFLLLPPAPAQDLGALGGRKRRRAFASPPKLPQEISHERALERLRALPRPVPGRGRRPRGKLA
jgi:hypothetical protein